MIKDAIAVARNTAVVNRYSQAHLNRQESVLEHTGFVCVVSMMIGMHHGGVNMGELMMKAAVHDLEESQIGDIANPVKYANRDILKEVNSIGATVMRGMSDELDLPDLYQVWAMSKDDSLEGRIVKMVDVIAVLAKLYEEVVLYSNVSIQSYGENTLAFFESQLDVETDSILISILQEAVHINKEILV